MLHETIETGVRLSLRIEGGRVCEVRWVRD